jgi:hypothetical protein
VTSRIYSRCAASAVIPRRAVQASLRINRTS